MLFFLISLKCFANDQDLADRLKQDLNHEANRRKAYKEFEDEKKKTEKEQNKGLSLWLEEQEKWDTAREKSISEHRKSRTKAKPLIVDARGTVQEMTKEYYDDVEQKQRALRVIEEGRKNHIKIKKEIIAQYAPKDVTSEEEELGIYNGRPRYDLRKRGKNRWTNSGNKLGGAGVGSSSGPSFGGDFNSGGSNSGGVQNDNFDFPPPPPATDFNDIPQDNFDDFPPPPPPPPADFGSGSGIYDSGFGDAPIPPPPPSQDGSWDF